MAEAYVDRGKGILVIPAVMPPMTSLSGEIRPVAERSKNYALPRFRFVFSPAVLPPVTSLTGEVRPEGTG